MAKSAVARSGAVRSVVAEVHEFCVANANPEIVRKYAKFFKEGYDAYGLDYRNPGWEEHRQAWGNRLRAAGPQAWLDAGDILTRTGKYEEASFAIEFAMDLSGLHTAVSFDRLGKWFEGGIRNWAHSDVICGKVLSHFLVDGIVGFEALASWRNSEYKFKRRAVPVMLLPLLDLRTDYETLFAVVQPLMTDPAREVHQGVGWFLREAWKRQPAVTEKFLMRYKDTAPRLIYQYATEKMTPELKARFRRTK
jgi:3-methyladenine DNA glycosylase AlkD